MDVIEALLDSWDRQCRIVDAVASRVDESNRHVKPSEDGWSLDYQLAHIHKVRHFFLTNVAPERAAELGGTYTDGWNGDLEHMRSLLAASGAAVRQAVKDALQGELRPFGWYDNPVLFLQHMVWHEGWHVGLIFLGLRLAGQEPPHEWEEAKVWGEWRTETY